jgi:hypothetical protein
VGNGLAEVGFLAALTIIVLPCCLFTLLALLDRFERNLDPTAQMPPQVVAKPAGDPASLAQESLDQDTAGAEVVSLPVPLAPVTVAEAPAAATG